MEELRVDIRWMVRRDMTEVLDIETSSFQYQWREDDFTQALQQRNCIGMVAEHGDRILGYMIYETHKTRIHILNFAVHPQSRRRGIGWQMGQKLISKLPCGPGQLRTRILLEVRERNLPAQMFFRSLGFRAVSVLRDFYEKSPEDAYLMQYRYQPTLGEALQPVNRVSHWLS